jgi:hypothetical protein
MYNLDIQKVGLLGRLIVAHLANEFGVALLAIAWRTQLTQRQRIQLQFQHTFVQLALDSSGR